MSKLLTRRPLNPLHPLGTSIFRLAVSLLLGCLRSLRTRSLQYAWSITPLLLVSLHLQSLQISRL
jgi:hypothetical protein